jgi:hypothetical protein
MVGQESSFPSFRGWGSFPNRVCRTVGTKDVIHVQNERKESLNNVVGGGSSGRRLT